MSRRVFLGVGSNIGDREAHLRSAIDRIPDVERVSSIWETAPVGGPEQGAYLNCVVQLRTELTARQLLEVCREREAAADRQRTEHWGPRTLDVDVLWIDGETVDESDLTVPHPRMFERAFVLIPLRELAPDLIPEDFVDPGPEEVRLYGGRRAGTFNLVGPGRAGSSLAAALESIGWRLSTTYRRGDDVTDAATGVDVCIIATSDAGIVGVAAAIRPGDAVVLHLSGATDLDALGAHRAAALHPLVSLPDPETGASRLPSAWFAVGGDPMAGEIAEAISGKWFPIADDDRTLYHAAAVVASNHVVALLGQAERIAAEVGVPFEALAELAAGSVANAAALGPEPALTGPAARGDDETIDRHVEALRERLPTEVDTYVAMVAEARNLAAGQ